MNRHAVIFFFICLVALGLVVCLREVSAAEYRIITSIPGTDIIASTTARNFSFAGYIRQIYIGAVAIVGFVAFIAIVYYGVRYTISGGNQSKIADAREGITQVILGIILLFAAYIILSTINPALVNLKDLNVQQPTGSSGGSGVGGGGTGGGNNPQSCDVTGCPAGNVCVRKANGPACEALPSGCTVGNNPSQGKYACQGMFRCQSQVPCDDFCFRRGGQNCTYTP